MRVCPTFGDPLATLFGSKPQEYEPFAICQIYTYNPFEAGRSKYIGNLALSYSISDEVITSVGP